MNWQCCTIDHLHNLDLIWKLYVSSCFCKSYFPLIFYGQQFHQYQQNEQPPLISNNWKQKQTTAFVIGNSGFFSEKKMYSLYVFCIIYICKKSNTGIYIKSNHIYSGFWLLFGKSLVLQSIVYIAIEFDNHRNLFLQNISSSEIPRV